MVLEKPLIQNESMLEATSLVDEYARYDRSPFEYMVRKELVRAKTMADLTPDVSMITNL